MKLCLCSPVACIFLIFFMGCSFISPAQKGFTLTIRDSVAATDSSLWLNNDIRIKNNRQKSLPLEIAINLPEHWHIVGKMPFSVVIEPGEERLVPVNIIKRDHALSAWQKAEVIIKDSNGNETLSRFFFLKAPPVHDFSLTVTPMEAGVNKETKEIIFTSLIKNNGNIEEELFITAKNNFFDLDNFTVKILQPGQEYQHKTRLRISGLARKQMVSENLRIAVRNKLQKTQTVSIPISNEVSFARQHVSSHPVFPVQLETGLMYFSNRFTYFNGIGGQLPLKKGKLLNFSYRTKQQGIANTIEQNAFSLEYVTKSWKFYAGQLTDIGTFFSFGQGLSITYTDRKENEVNARAIFHYKNNPYKSDVFSLYIKHRVRNTLLRHSIGINSLPREERFAIAITNEIDLVQVKNFNLSLNLNAGQYHYMFKIPQAGKERAGAALGYSAGFNTGRFRFSSAFNYANNLYPGVLSGTINQNHSVSWIFRKISFEAYYRYNTSNKSNILIRDTVFNQTYFDLDFEQYGLRTKIQAGNNTEITIGGGHYRQTGFGRIFLASANFADFSILYKNGRNWRIRLNSTNGFGESGNGFKTNNIWISRTNFTISYRQMGVTAFYMRTPLVRAINPADSARLISETMNIAPYIGFNLFRVMNVNLSYSIAKTLFDRSLSTFTNMNVSYNNKHNGLTATLSGNIPVSNTSDNFSSLANNSIVLSVKKDLNIPNIFRKKYYTLKLVLFQDDNLDNIRQPNESPVKNARVVIGGRTFITNNSGTITYKNADKKVYIIDLAGTKAARGYVPAGGTLHFAELEKNLTKELSFKKGKVISGKITVTLDSLTKKSFSAGKLKVIATDTLGNNYRTLANENGDFYINVPPGLYKVTLNPDAFSKDIKPVQMFFMINVGKERDEEIVNFEIRENKRQIRYFNKQ